jgi:hypothetical protein
MKQDATSSTNVVFDSLDWAKRLRSQAALDLLAAGAKDGDSRLSEILAGHVRDGVCTEPGQLLQRWDGLAWMPVDKSEHRNAA